MRQKTKKINSNVYGSQINKFAMEANCALVNSKNQKAKYDAKIAAYAEYSTSVYNKDLNLVFFIPLNLEPPIDVTNFKYYYDQAS